MAAVENKFTFHNVSINTATFTYTEEPETHLHSTMFLLILVSGFKGIGVYIFTFHNVSINTIL